LESTMRLSLTAAVVTAGLCLIVASVVLADVRQPVPESTRYTARRGSTNLPNPQPTTVIECDTKVEAAIEAEGKTRTSGNIVYQCITTKSYIVTFVPPPVVLPPVDCVVSEWGVWSDPPWLACADGFQSRSIVRTRTIVTQPANGGAACPALVETQPQTRVCPGAAILSWTLPTRNTDGSSLTNLAGVRVHFGTLPNEPINSVQLTGPLTRHVLYNLPAGTIYFGVRAYSSAGTESALSNIESKVVL
jgi:hypothetical protein